MSLDEEELQLNNSDSKPDGEGDVKQEAQTEAAQAQEAQSQGEQGAQAQEVQPQSEAQTEQITQTEQEAQTQAQTEQAQAQTEQTQVQAQTATEIKPPKSKKSKIIWNVILVALIGLGIFSLFGIVNEIEPGSGSSFVQVFGNASPWFMLLLVGIVLVIMILDCTKFCIIDKTVTGNVRFSSSVKTSFLGKYYDAITPFATGGQPMQIYYLNSKGISGGNSTAIVLIRYFSSIITWVILGSGLMIAGTVMHVLDGTSGKTLLLVAGWVGVGINLIIPLFITFFLVFPKVMYKLTGGCVKLGKKMKIVKDEERALKRATRVVDDFKHSFKVMATSPIMLVLLILVSFAEAFLTFSVPYFVMKAFSCDVHGLLITVMALNAFATFGVSFVPTPGNSGVMESMAALAFSAAAGNTLVWSVLVWRLAVYYIYIIIGLIISVRDIIKKNIVKRRKHKKPQKTE